MRFRSSERRRRPLPFWTAFGLTVLAALAPRSATAQDEVGPTRMELYGFVMLDAGYQFGQNDPLWFDVLRPTKLPAFDEEFGEDGRTFWGVRQTRFGVRTWTETPPGELRTTFEWELFGVGVDAGQTTIRLRHAYVELEEFGAGQYWSPFMDIDVFPNSIEYWGPNGMAFFRNVQIRYMPIHDQEDGDKAAIALERPGASGDGGVFADRIELDNVQGRFPVPDLSAEYREAGDWGYVELAGILRYIKWDDLLDDQFDLEGDDLGWGLNLSSNIKFGDEELPNVVRLSVVFGEGIQNYMNDAPVDVGIRANPGSARRPIEGEALGLLGLVAFYDHWWSEKFSSSIGWSMLDISNSDLQTDLAFDSGHYALANLLYYPTPKLMAGVELQYGTRNNFDSDLNDEIDQEFEDGFSSDDFRIQVSVRGNFSLEIGGTR
jgi:hypothetical protein